MEFSEKIVCLANRWRKSTSNQKRTSSARLSSFRANSIAREGEDDF